MTPDLWARVCQHFDRLVDLPKDQLQSELEGLQSIDPQLAREVSNLLQGADDESNLPTPLDLPNDAFRALEEYLSRARGTRLPSEIQGYRLGRKLGQGGFGEVYLAELQDERAQVPVAIKILTVSDQHDRVEEARQRFEREGTILQQIPPHAQVIKLLDRGRVGRWPYLILEYVEEARNLRQYCDENQLSIQQRLLLFLRVASVVNYLHHERVLHCDLKPANILVSKEGKVKIIDFGIAKSLRDEEETELTSDPRSRPRTDAYCAPEQARGEPLTVSVDVYSLGVILYELLVGTRPFQSSLLAPVDIVLDPVLKLDELSEERLRDIEKNRDTTIEALKEKLSEQSLRTILTYATHQDPDKRYQTVLELFDDVERYLQGIVPDKLAASFSDVEQRLPVSEPHWLGPRFARSPVRMTILLSLLFTFGPHVIGSVVSIFYNKTLIASGLSPHQASVFERLIWYYNGIMYPIGLAFWLWLVLPIRKTFQQIEQFGTKVEKSRLSLAETVWSFPPG